MKKRSLLGLIAALLGLLFCLYLPLESYIDSQKRIHIQMKEIWAKDFEALRAQNILPPAFNDLGQIDYERSNESEFPWIGRIRKPEGIMVNEKGKHRLLLSIIGWTFEKKSGVIIIYELYDGTNELIWELGRTYSTTKSASEY